MHIFKPTEIKVEGNVVLKHEDGLSYFIFPHDHVVDEKYFQFSFGSGYFLNVCLVLANAKN